MTAYTELLAGLRALPALYEDGPLPFWDDEYISQNMLAAHLDPDMDAASRKHKFLQASADWIKSYCGGGTGKRLLDLGCGPGLYAERLAAHGFSVTGFDFSHRSIAYAREMTKKCSSGIDYRLADYLSLDAENEFDAAILIYCDYGVLSPEKRRLLLQKVYRALKKNGVLILDAWNRPYSDTFVAGERVRYYENGGFFSPEPHALIERNCFYGDKVNTLEQYFVLTADACRRYHIWNQIFSQETMEAELQAAGFSRMAFFDDVAGAPFTGRAETLCIAAEK